MKMSAGSVIAGTVVLCSSVLGIIAVATAKDEASVSEVTYSHTQAPPSSWDEQVSRALYYMESNVERMARPR